MGINFVLANFDQLIGGQQQTPIILNDLPTVTQADRDFIDRQTHTVYDQTDVFSNEPRCECGKITRGHNIGVVCGICHMPCVEPYSQPLENRVWFRSPKGVERLINPTLYKMLEKRFTKSNFSLLEYLINTEYKIPVDLNSLIVRDLEELENQGFDRGYNNFVRNFDRLFESMTKLKSFVKKREFEQLKDLFKVYPDSMFSNYLPLPNKSLIILENMPTGRYMDPTVPELLDAIKTIRGIDTPLSTLTQRQRENRTAKTLITISNYHYTSHKERLAKKQGIIRKNALGTRVNFSMRAVISSITDPHHHRKLEIPWGPAVTMLKLHLTNKLMNQHDYTPGQAEAFLREYTVKWHPLLSQLFKELIAESPGGLGLPVIFERNPSLSRSSTQALWIYRVKDDVTDPTIGMSILIVNGFNAMKLAHSVRKAELIIS